jgi:Type II secretion system (T2SS), protein N
MALLGAVVFAVVVIVRLPAEWIIPGTAARACTTLEGSLWSGSCAGLVLSGTPVGDVSWSLKPLRLLAGRLAAHVKITHGAAASASGDLEVGFGGAVIARHVVADLPLDPRLLPGLPQTLHGSAHAELALAQVRQGVLTQLEGRIEARNLEDRSGGADTPLGSYLVTFPGGSGQPIGKLRDLEGPVALEGTLRLTPQPGFELEGQIAPRQGASPELVNNIRFLGSPDASGRRPFAISGTF